MNLTDRQMQLLRILVANDEAVGGKEFYFVRHRSGSGLCYEDGKSIRVDCTDMDLFNLQRERLITLVSRQNALRGQPTPLGIRVGRGEASGIGSKIQIRENSETSISKEPLLSRDENKEGASPLPSVTPGGDERIRRALNDAAGVLKQAPTAPEQRRTAILHYFDALAWEYVCTMPVAAFEDLIEAIGEKARSAFDGAPETLSDRRHYWITEARERSANGITGTRVPMRIQPHHADIFQKLEPQFRRLPAGESDLQAMFTDGGHYEIRPGPRDLSLFDRFSRCYEQLARQAMVALGFRFSNPARAVHYWIDLLRQENPHLKGWRIPNLCFESAAFCLELKTRALESSSLARQPNATGPGPMMALRPQSWEGLAIRFLSDERVQLVVGDERETLNYAEFGFEDGRSKKPNLAWTTLRTLAEQQGTLSQPTDASWAKVEKRIQEIRRVFRGRFGVNDDPLPYTNGVGYKARFQIGCAPSYCS